jgi:hypothetical protein
VIRAKQRLPQSQSTVLTSQSTPKTVVVISLGSGSGSSAASGCFASEFYYKVLVRELLHVAVQQPEEFFSIVRTNYHAWRNMCCVWGGGRGAKTLEETMQVGKLATVEGYEVGVPVCPSF